MKKVSLEIQKTIATVKPPEYEVKPPKRALLGTRDFVLYQEVCPH